MNEISDCIEISARMDILWREKRVPQLVPILRERLKIASDFLLRVTLCFLCATLCKFLKRAMRVRC